MHPWTLQFSPDEGKECLANLQCLAGELETAMRCIASRELCALQESIQVQQTVCSRLAHMQRGRSVKLSDDRSVGVSCIESGLASQIEVAIVAVVSLNRRYAALLKHSGETLRLFAGLARSYHGPTQLNCGTQANLQTWSCEV